MSEIHEERRVVSILFADVQGYSALAGDELQSRVATFVEEFGRRHLTPDNHILFKTAGDGMLICSDDPVDLAEIALSLKDYFGDRNAWRRMGWADPMKVRIGVLSERVRVRYRGPEVIDVIGHNVNSAARIEPVVDPGSVFCSATFASHVRSDPEVEYAWRQLGTRSLAKNFGEMELWDLSRIPEAETPSGAEAASAAGDEFSPPVPRVRRDITDRDRARFLRDSFSVIRDYFQLSVSRLEATHDGLNADFEAENPISFRVTVYVDGQERASCRAWMADELGSRQILFSEGQVWSDGSYNEAISADDNGYELQLRQLMGGGLVGLGEEDKPSTPEEVAQSLWTRFIRYLE